MAEDDKLYTLQFIADYKNLPQLWDNNNAHYTNKIKRNQGLQSLATKYRLDIVGVKKKIKSLRSYFSKEYNRVIKKNIDDGDDETYHSSWFAFNHLLFIADSEFSKDSKNLTEATKLPEVLVNEDSGEEVHVDQECGSIFGKKRGYVTDDKREEIIKKIKLAAEKQGSSYQPVGSSGRPSANYPTQESAHRDACAIFGELVAINLRNLNPRNRITAQRQISNIFFDLELQQLDSGPNQVENPVLSVVPTAHPPLTTPAAETVNTANVNNSLNSQPVSLECTPSNRPPSASQYNSEHIDDDATLIKKEEVQREHS